jgi:hypothetical protein
MKYTEFIKNMNSLGFSVEIGNAETLICKRVNSGTAVISISKTFENSMGINIATCTLNETMAIKLATKLAMTPLNDRIGSAQYEIMLPNLLTSAENRQYITEYKGYYFVSAPSSQYGKRVFSEYDMLNVPKEYHIFAKDIETGEPYISKGVSL